MNLCQKYSDIGEELMIQAQRENVALTTVQADFLRASWLKNIGKGVEAWRSIGNAIRSAQELELHRHKNAHEQGLSTPGTTLSRMWYEEYKRRLWMNLCTWDALTAMILGRPRAIHPDDCDVEEPTECNIPQDPSTCAPGTQEAIVGRDRPNTVSNNLFLYRLSSVWHTMKALKADRSYLQDYSIVEQLHDQVNRIMNRLPLTLRHEHPNLSWDNQYPYLRQQREDILTKANLMLIAIHRPHMMYRAEARRAALQAAIVILDSQHRSFMMARPHQYKLFGLSFYTIDASLLLSVMAARYLPQKDSEVMVKIDYVLHQAINRLSAMHSYSPIARSGLTILGQCYHVLRKRLECNTATLDSLKATATDLGNLEQEFEVDVVKDSLSERRPRPPHQQYQQHNQQESVSNAPISLPSGCSASSPPISSEPNSSQSGWTFDTTADAGFVATTAVQPSPHLGPWTTDFDETYWLSMINEIPDVPNTDPTETVQIGGTVDAAALEYNTVWNQIQFFE
ncbi:Fungal specific transcription factor domain-containing protein [Cladophialophora immunda]|nr:Fungal specific transcription factor domain-containing protein [Cladophialophora immunda]